MTSRGRAGHAQPGMTVDRRRANVR